MSRTRAFASAGMLAGLLFVLLLLGGCAQPAPTLGDPAEALGDSYERALEAMAERVDDPVLLAVQCKTTQVGEDPTWTYLFGSKSMSFMYSVTPDAESGEYSASTYGRLEWAEKSWESIPEPDSVTVSSSDALRAVAEACADDPMRSYSANLVMFLSGDGSADTSTSPMKWEVIVNPSDEELSGTCFTVDAATGEIAQKVVADDADNSDEGGEASEEEPDLGPKGTGYKSTS